MLWIAWLWLNLALSEFGNTNAAFQPPEGRRLGGTTGSGNVDDRNLVGPPHNASAGHPHHRSNDFMTVMVPEILVREYDYLHRRAFEKLQKSFEAPVGFLGDAKRDRPFDDIEVSLPIPPPFLAQVRSATEKIGIIGTHAIKERGKGITVYAFGSVDTMATDTAALGASVHVFNCNAAAGSADQADKIQFRRWCLGKPSSNNTSSDKTQTSRHNSITLANVDSANSNASIAQMPLSLIKSKLGHRMVDILRLDLHGLEWDVLQSEIVHGEEGSLPEQLLFKLHTQGTNSAQVAVDSVKGKSRAQVNQLVFALMNRGYRVWRIAVSPSDPYCAELSFARVKPYQLANSRIGTSRYTSKTGSKNGPKSTLALLPVALVREFNCAYQHANDRLVSALKAPTAFIGNRRDSPFGDLEVALPTPQELAHTPANSPIQDDKYYLGANTIKLRGSNFTAYGFGTNGEIAFEKNMASFGSSVFAFDCTDKGKAEWASILTFKQWCLGRAKSFEGNNYSKNAGNSNFTFMSLTQIKSSLGHNAVDIFKMDIEGFEWDILDTEIIHGDEDSLPEQLLFELHTQGAAPAWVPPKLVEGKTRDTVNRVVNSLMSRGYRLLSIQINPGDIYCAELAFARCSKYFAKKLARPPS